MKPGKLSGLNVHFLSKFSHDIRSYVHITLGMISLIKTDPLVHLEERLDLIEESCEQTKMLLEDILLIEKIQHPPLFYENIILSELMLFLNGTMTVLLQGNLTTFYIDTQCSPQSIIKTHRSSLYRILINLLNNAVKYGDCPTIILKINQLELSYNFLVFDSGLDERICPSHSTYRVHKSESYGLGLIICRELVSQMGGTLTLKNNYSAEVCLPIIS